jgi:hypothetical protein
MFVQPRSQLKPTAPGASERRGVSETSDRVVLVSPAEGQQVTNPATPFTWHIVPGATYRVDFADESGSTVYQAHTSDTSIVLPSSVRSAGTYYWTVTALAPDGTSVTSGAREFGVAAR